MVLDLVAGFAPLMPTQRFFIQGMQTDKQPTVLTFSRRTRRHRAGPRWQRVRASQRLQWVLVSFLEVDPGCSQVLGCSGYQPKTHVRGDNAEDVEQEQTNEWELSTGWKTDGSKGV